MIFIFLQSNHQIIKYYSKFTQISFTYSYIIHEAFPYQYIDKMSDMLFFFFLIYRHSQACNVVSVYFYHADVFVYFFYFWLFILHIILLLSCVWNYLHLQSYCIYLYSCQNQGYVTKSQTWLWITVPYVSKRYCHMLKKYLAQFALLTIISNAYQLTL